MIGKTLSHFRIVEKLGEGGMGVVYRAEDIKLRRQVALKVLPPELVANEERRLRFLREARAAATVSHPNIAAIYEVDEAEGGVFIAMELVEGKTLREIIGGRPLPIKDALRIAAEMAEGLAHAHQARVIHRDFKPDNVMIRPDQHVKILDFGLAKHLEKHPEASTEELSKLETISGAVTRAGKVLGTPAYMSPEQARGQPLDARSDIFAFGTTLYEMVTGRPPFLGETRTDTLSAITRDEPTPPSRLNAEVPAELERIIGECLEKDPAERYQHAEQLAVDLRKLRRVTDTGAQAVRTPEPCVPSAAERALALRRAQRLWRAAAIAACGLLLAAGALFGWRQFRPPARFQSGDRVLVANFEITKGRPELEAAIRDSFEEMLGQSRFLDVLRGERLKEVLERSGHSGASRIDATLAGRVCDEGACSGFVSGKVRAEGVGSHIEVTLHHAGRKNPVLVRSNVAPSEGDILAGLHSLAIELRKAVGESAESVSMTDPPTTGSLLAYQAFSAADPELAGRADLRLALNRRALELDPGFADAMVRVANELWNLGDYRGYRETMGKAYQASSNLSERRRLALEIDYLEASYEIEKEIQRLTAYGRLYPFDDMVPNYLSITYQSIYEDLGLAEKYARSAYDLVPSLVNLNNSANALFWQGRADEIEALLASHRSQRELQEWSQEFLMWAEMVRGDDGAIRELAEQRGRHSARAKNTAMRDLLRWLLASGRLREAEQVGLEAGAAARVVGDLGARFSAVLAQIWLAKRIGRASVEFSPEDLAAARGSLRYLPRLAAFSVDVRIAAPLASVLAEHESAEKNSPTLYVREELGFGRACLALIRGDGASARATLEPLVQSRGVSVRHRMLGRAYEALGMWKEAAEEYERVLKNPHLKWEAFDIPAVQVLEQFRLAQIYESLGDRSRARQWYERFLADWKDADPDIPEITEARKRLAALAQAQRSPSEVAAGSARAQQ